MKSVDAAGYYWAFAKLRPASSVTFALSDEAISYSIDARRKRSRTPDSFSITIEIMSFCYKGCPRADSSSDWPRISRPLVRRAPYPYVLSATINKTSTVFKSCSKYEIISVSVVWNVVQTRMNPSLALSKALAKLRPMSASCVGDCPFKLSLFQIWCNHMYLQRCFYLSVSKLRIQRLTSYVL